MPRRTHLLRLISALTLGVLLAAGLAACGGSSRNAAATLETPPLTVPTGATLPRLPSPRRLIRIKILATAFASRRAASHAENVSV